MSFDNTLHECSGFQEAPAKVFTAAWEWLDNHGVRFVPAGSPVESDDNRTSSFLQAFDVIYITHSGMYLRRSHSPHVRILDTQERMGYLAENSEDGRLRAGMVHVYTSDGVVAHLAGDDAMDPPTPVGQLPVEMFRAMHDCGVI